MEEVLNELSASDQFFFITHSSVEPELQFPTLLPVSGLVLIIDQMIIINYAK